MDKTMVSQSLRKSIIAVACTKNRPDDSSYISLGWDQACSLCESFKVDMHTVECSALTEDIVPERYARNQKSLSCGDQLRLLQSHAAIIGLGGLGGTITDLLARLGVGYLSLIDGDHFDASNLNRQLLSRPDLLGKSKAECAAAHVLQVNPAVRVQSETTFFSKKNGAELLKSCDIAIDCLDTIPARMELQEICFNVGIPMISAAVGGTSGQATVIFPGDPGLKTLYRSADKSPSRGIEASLGTLSFSACTMAAIECCEAATILLNRPSQLRNHLLLTEIGEHQSELVELPGGN